MRAPASQAIHAASVMLNGVSYQGPRARSTAASLAAASPGNAGTAEIKWNCGMQLDGRTAEPLKLPAMQISMPPRHLNKHQNKQRSEVGEVGDSHRKIFGSASSHSTVGTQYSQLAFLAAFRRRTHHSFCDRPMSGTSNEYDDASVPE